LVDGRNCAALDLGRNFLFVVNHNGDTALHLASRNGQEKVVEIFLKFSTRKKIDWKMLFAGNRIGDIADMRPLWPLPGNFTRGKIIIIIFEI
jgi:ankyrin repeat protein